MLVLGLGLTLRTVNNGLGLISQGLGTVADQNATVRLVARCSPDALDSVR